MFFSGWTKGLPSVQWSVITLTERPPSRWWGRDSGAIDTKIVRDCLPATIKRCRSWRFTWCVATAIICSTSQTASWQGTLMSFAATCIYVSKAWVCRCCDKMGRDNFKDNRHSKCREGPENKVIQNHRVSSGTMKESCLIVIFSLFADGLVGAWDSCCLSRVMESAGASWTRCLYGTGTWRVTNDIAYISSRFVYNHADIINMVCPEQL